MLGRERNIVMRQAPCEGDQQFAAEVHSRGGVAVTGDSDALLFGCNRYHLTL